MGVSRNLELALENLRSVSEQRSLWIDAICIDQGNLQERNRQVALMRDIYRAAKRVLIWLGESKDDSDLAFDMIDKLSTDVRDLDQASFDSFSIRVAIPPITEIPDETMEALTDIFSCRSWWSRIWVIQEVVSARDALIICGEKSLSWTLLERLLDSEEETVLAQCALPKVRAQLASTMHTAILFAAVRKQYRNDPAFESNASSQYTHGLRYLSSRPMGVALDVKIDVYKYGMCPLLALFESNACTDPRDRIYALQNIVDPGSGTIEPNYAKDVMEVFAQSTQQIIAKTGNLDILAYIYRSNPRPHSGPSWVPDWSTPRQFSTLLAGPSMKSLYKSDKDEFQYAHSNNIKLPTSFPYGLLGLVGYIKDEVTQILQVVNTRDLNWRDWFRCWLPERLATASPVELPEHSAYLTKDSYFVECDDYWRAVMLDVRRPATGWPVRIAAYEESSDAHYYRHLFLMWTRHPRYLVYTDESSSQSYPSPKPVVKDSYREVRFEECIGEHLHGWAFCKMRNGSYGWVPQTAQVGDLVCVAIGSSLPLLLRRSYREVNPGVLDSIQWAFKPRFEFIGTAYVQGYMDGLHWSHKREEYGELVLI
jgi:hypothetical protein